MTFVTFYHYTSRAGKAGIIQSGDIKESQPPHTHHGPGTYGTSLPPSHGKLNIAINNWSEAYAQYYTDKGLVDIAFELKIPKEKVTSFKPAGGRTVLKHEGPIHLIDYEYTWHTTSW